MSQSEDSTQEQNGGKRYIEIRRGTVDSLLVCEITEYEWDSLKRGRSESIFLNFGIALFSIGCSFFISLLTTTMDSPVFITFTVIVSTFAIGSIILILLWWSKRRSTNPLIKEIDRRFSRADAQGKDAE